MDYAFFPINHPNLEKFYQRQKNVIWTPQEIDLSSDRADWDVLDDNTKRFIEFILCFFAQADGIVNENLVSNFKRETSHIKEVGFFYSVQEFMEVIHNETYSNLIEAFIRDRQKKQKAFNAISHYPAIAKIGDWTKRWMNTDIPLISRVIAFACLEGVLFSSAFAAIYWIKKKGILPGLCKANEFIARDEAIHTEFAVALYHHLTTTDFEPLSQEEVCKIIDEAVGVSSEFIKSALNVDLVGMNSKSMIEYVKCTADTLCESLGYEKIYNIQNPYEWMAIIGLPNKTNFFEARVSEYGRQSENIEEFSMDEDF